MTAQAAARERLDEHFLGLKDRLGPRPTYGWVRTIRDALGMSTYEFAWRMGVSQSRIAQIERGEIDGSMRIFTLERAAASLNCHLCYALVPNEPLQVMVHRQALRKAELAVARLSGEGTTAEDRSWNSEALAEQVEALAEELIDRRGLWTTRAPVAKRRLDRLAQKVQTSTT